MAATTRANWGAKEDPRECMLCGSIRSGVESVRLINAGATRIRKRVCLECSRKFDTWEQVEQQQEKPDLLQHSKNTTARGRK